MMKRFLSMHYLIALFATYCGLASLPSHAQTKPDANGAPNVFVQQVAEQALHALKADSKVRAGDTVRVNQIVDELLLPYVDFEKTTRLSAGRYWKQATPEQQAALVKAFRATLGRTYSGALTRVDDATTMKTLAFRGEEDAKDVVVKSQVVQHANSQPVQLDYRLEKTTQGWKIYDINVENVWLIENYRNQFAQQIGQNGIDGLISALNQKNK